MRSNILTMLRAANGFVSGEKIADKLGISRTAVWKHINELRKKGYIIDSVPKNGYILKNSPDLLIPAEIMQRLSTKLIGQKIIYHESIPSSNNLAKNLAANGAKDGTLVIAEEQANGRGRLSRRWYSPKGLGLWFSVILRPDFFLPRDAPKCTLLAAVAVARAMKNIDLRADIKWPNDIMHNGKKLVGILTEMSAQPDGIDFIVIGMGVNVNIGNNDLPDELKPIATSLSIMKGEKINRVALLNDILMQLEELYFTVKEHGFNPITNEWKKYSVTLNRSVNVLGINEQFTGIAIDIDDEGALLVKTDEGIKRVLAGDVSVRENKNATSV